jgi:hypothetical protein
VLLTRVCGPLLRGEKEQLRSWRHRVGALRLSAVVLCAALPRLLSGQREGSMLVEAFLYDGGDDLVLELVVSPPAGVCGLFAVPVLCVELREIFV